MRPLVISWQESWDGDNGHPFSCALCRVIRRASIWHIVLFRLVSQELEESEHEMDGGFALFLVIAEIMGQKDGEYLAACLKERGITGIDLIKYWIDTCHQDITVLRANMPKQENFPAPTEDLLNPWEAQQAYYARAREKKK
jgi:hypothetical protein